MCIPDAVELAIFAAGVPPEYRIWLYRHGELLPPAAGSVEVVLTRLGGTTDSRNDLSPVTALVWFVPSALAEIPGCRLVWFWLRRNGSAWWLLPAAASLAVFAEPGRRRQIDRRIRSRVC